MAKQKVDTTNYCNMTDEQMYGLYRVKSSPVFWRQKAEQLKYSADLLISKAVKRIEKVTVIAMRDQGLNTGKLPPDTFGIGYGLLGFSLECLMKACIIRDNPGFVDKGKQNDELKNHNLVILADIGRIGLNPREKISCEKLTECMYVDFRYPIDRFLKPDKGFLYSKTVVEDANQIFERLHKVTDQWHYAKGGQGPSGLKTSNLKVRPIVKKSPKKRS